MKFKGFKNREDRVDIYTDLALEEREKFKDNVEIDAPSSQAHRRWRNAKPIR